MVIVANCNSHKYKRLTSKTSKNMTDYELEKYCNTHPYCDCNCMKCEAFAANHRYHMGYEDDDDDDDWE